MPSAPPRPCTQPGCKEYATKDGRCSDHQREGWTAWSQRKGTRHERGYGHYWDKLRKRILMRDSYLCQECLRRNRLTTATEVDHIVNKASGGTNEDSNLEALCRPCHKAKTITERRN